MSPNKDPEHGANETTPLIGAAAVTSSSNPDGVQMSEVGDDEYFPTTPNKLQLRSFSEDVLDTVKLGVPIFISTLSWVGVSVCVFVQGHCCNDCPGSCTFLLDFVNFVRLPIRFGNGQMPTIVLPSAVNC
jgi:hypothetical protein